MSKEGGRGCCVSTRPDSRIGGGRERERAGRGEEDSWDGAGGREGQTRRKFDNRHPPLLQFQGCREGKIALHLRMYTLQSTAAASSPCQSVFLSVAEQFAVRRISPLFVCKISPHLVPQL